MAKQPTRNGDQARAYFWGVLGMFAALGMVGGGVFLAIRTATRTDRA